ncbi:hypothetical protein GPECTOR_3g152 [Gonium pectorale]|uniref:Protein kinase domain-containing protein n=1 Tax=Gonium pectorale TaxID=33097 RepID=A0A150GYK6_GONPE|nr:hypothetical protein GPECTOR_3g152 [Gonium pectorale]|eukprot:KXZ54987.1 hypothetical protein GPECTOR_3g152 [Gonium pectorale]
MPCGSPAPAPEDVIDERAEGAVECNHMAFLDAAALGSARFVRHLGRGNFGTVDLVEVTTPDGTVRAARKTLSPKGPNSVKKTKRQMIDTLSRELRGTFSACRYSPFATSVLGISLGAAGHCIYTEFADGGSLAGMLELQMPVSELQKLAFSLLHALSAMNDVGYAHLDIKPDNVLVARSKYLLADFGNAAELGPNPKVHGLRGSSIYIAPEQWEGQAYGLNADCFSLGLLLAQCAVWPHSPAALVQLIQGQRALPGCVPEELRDFITALMLEDTAARPSPKEAM